MSVIERVVHHTQLHIHTERESVDMQPKEFIFGNSKVIVHSKLVHMDKKEQREWFAKELNNHNPVLKNIVHAAYACQKTMSRKETNKTL
jgi:hypothetical protein